MVICFYIIVIVYNEGFFKDFVFLYIFLFDRVVRLGIFGGIGKKVNERGLKRKRVNNLSRDVFDYGDRVLVVIFVEDADEETSVVYEVVFVYNIKVIICYGCKGCVREKLVVVV